MYPAVPTGVAVSEDGLQLLVYSETHIDVFDTPSGEWVQSVNIRRTRPLGKTGTINLSMLQEMPHVTYMANIHKGAGGVGRGSKLLIRSLICKMTSGTD